MTAVVPEDYLVQLRGPNYEVLEELSDFRSLDCVARDNDIGTWHLELPARSPVASRITDRTGLIVKRDGETIFSGWADEIARTNDTITLSGRDDMALLLTPARPDPSLPVPPFSVEYNVLTGVASTMYQAVVNANIGPAAPLEWRMPITFAADPGLGVAPVTLRGRMQPLLAILQESAASPQAGGLGFRLIQSDTVANALEFRVYEPVDRSADAKFSTELGTAADFEDVRTLPSANAVFAGLGDGLGNLRTIIYGEDVPSILAVGRRLGAFIDLRDTANVSEAQQRLAEALAGAVISRKATITPTPVPSLVYGRDYDLGDLVSFAVDGDVMTDLIREVRLTIDEHGATITPMVGQAGSTNDQRTAQYIASVQDRLLNLERNWSVPDDSITLAMMRANSVGMAQIVAGSVTPAALYAVSPPNNNEVPAYNSAAQRFQYQPITALLGTNPTFTGITVTGNTTLGDGVGGDTVTVNATPTFATRIVSTVTTGTAPFTIASTTMVANLNAEKLGGQSAADFALLAGAAFTGNVSVSGNGLFVDAATNKVRVNSATVSGWDLTVGTGGILAEGASRIQGQLLVSTGGLDVTGSSTFHNAVTVSAGGIDATGSSTFHNSVTVSSGGIGVTGSSAFNNAVTITTGGLTVQAGGASITGTVSVTGGLSASLSSSFSAGLSVGGGLSVTTGAVTFPNTTLGFFGSAANAKQAVTGSRSAATVAVLTALLSALANYGLITDSTTV